MCSPNFLFHFSVCGVFLSLFPVIQSALIPHAAVVLWFIFWAIAFLLSHLSSSEWLLNAFFFLIPSKMFNHCFQLLPGKIFPGEYSSPVCAFYTYFSHFAPFGISAWCCSSYLFGLVIGWVGFSQVNICSVLSSIAAQGLSVWLLPLNKTSLWESMWRPNSAASQNRQWTESRLQPHSL